MLKKITAAFAGIIMVFAIALTAAAEGAEGAAEYADTNREIEIIPGKHVGYQFVGSSSNPDIIVDITKIAKVKYYIKCPELEWLGPAEVQLVFNSGTTGWSQAEMHDLHDGLIIERDVPKLAEGDYFEALLGTWNEEIAGTVSFEVLDADGNALGANIYGVLGTGGASETTPATTTPEATQDITTDVTTVNTAVSDVLGTGDANVNTGGQEIAAICVATVLSVGVIIAARRKNK